MNPATAKKLDSILHVCLFSYALKLANDPRHKQLTFQFIATSLHKDMPDWEVAFLKQTLINDGHLFTADPSEPDLLDLTPDGIKQAQTGGYNQALKDAEIIRQTQKAAISADRKAGFALIVSVLAIIIPLGYSVYQSGTSKPAPTTEEFQYLRRQVDSLTKELYLLKGKAMLPPRTVSSTSD